MYYKYQYKYKYCTVPPVCWGATVLVEDGLQYITIVLTVLYRYCTVLYCTCRSLSTIEGPELIKVKPIHAVQVLYKVQYSIYGTRTGFVPVPVCTISS